MSNYDEEHTPLSDRRLLTFKDFCVYSGLHRDKAREFLKSSNVVISFGKRTNLIDRKKFDDWCDKQCSYSTSSAPNVVNQSVFSSRRHSKYGQSVK